MARATDKTGRGRRGGTVALATALGAGTLLLSAGDALAVDSLSVSASPGAQATVPMTIGASGSTSGPSKLRVFVAQGGNCANTGSASTSAAAQALRSGSVEVLSQDPSGGFSYVTSYTPPAAGSYAVCAYLFRASDTSNVSSQVSQGFAVAAAPAATTPPPPAGDTGDTGDTTVAQTKHCVVPKLKNHTYEGARKLLHRAGCIVGKVAKPDKKKARPLKRGGRTRILKVSTQSSPAGAVRRARAPISLRLKYVTPKS
jgi:hypothetical protein